MYTLSVSLYKHNGKVTTALRLEGVETHLNDLHLAHPAARVETVLIYVMVVLYTVHLGEFITLVWSAFDGKVPLTHVVMIFYYNLVKCTQLFSLSMLFIKCLRIQYAINEGLEGVCVSGGDLPVIALVQRRVAWARPSQSILADLYTIRRICADVEDQLRSFYWLFIVWVAVVTVTATPTLSIVYLANSDLHHWISAPTTIAYTVFCSIIVLARCRYRASKLTTHIRLAGMLGSTAVDDSAIIRRYLRAFSSSSEPFD